MCNPVIAMVAVSVVQAAVAKKQGDDQASAINAQGAQNARLAEMQAKDAAIMGARDSEQAAWKLRDAIGSQKVAAAANGVEMSGSAMDAVLESAMMGGAEQSAIAQNTARNVWAIQSGSLNDLNQSRQAAWSARSQGQLSAMTALGQAATTVAGARAGTKKAASVAPQRSWVGPR